MVTIRFYKDIDKPLWDSYILNHPNGTFFHLIGWKTVIEKTFHHKPFYLVAEASEEIENFAPLPKKDGSTPSPQNSVSATDSVTSGIRLNPQAKRSSNVICGILPLFSVKSFLFCKSLVSLPFAAYGGILADGQDITQQLLDKAKEITSSERLEYLELRSRDGAIAGLSTKDLYVIFQRKIFDDLESNMAAIPRKSRRMIRQGEKAGLTYEFGHQDLILLFYEIFARSYHRLGSPVFPIKFFENLLNEFKEQTNILVVRTRDGKPISTVLTFFYKDQVLPYFAGSLFEYRDLAPNDYMYWQLMKYGHEKGYKWFDFGRSKVDTGSYDFKRHWGFEPEPLAYQYFLNRVKDIPNISPANPKYQKKIEMWRKMPFWLTKIIGPHIVKYIP